MGKKSRLKNRATKKQRMPFVARTFEGLPHEVDWIAMREFVPSATATARTTDGTAVTVCSLLPGGGAGLVRPDGDVWLGLQVMHNFGDVSRDLAHVLELARDTAPGNPVIMSDPGVGPRLQDVLDTSAPFEVEVLDGFDYWLEGVDTGEDTETLLEEANESVAPTARLASVDGAYWTEMGSHRYLRWVMTHDDSDLLDALARLQAARADTLTEDSRFIGHFRAHGLLVPVWEMEVGADALEEPAAAFEDRLGEALADDAPLTPEQRSARSNIVSRQVAIR
jgi:hypothetical protein